VAIAPGARIGVYEVVSLIGSGGMGEVYLARDTQLGRNVALKVLPEMYAADAERLARFRREAQVLAALHHPNIAVIHGLEDAEGARALVLEYIEGDTLADRIAAGRIPLDEVLDIARQIAEALQAAHDQGVIHRDLKPSNIKLTPEGAVKVLDFGLAKLGAQSEAASGGSSSVSLSPTITSPAATSLGVILGTAAYMAPEQAKGRPADKRSDVWAFGGVLFEMLTGKRAFEGDDISETLASVIKGEPDWAALPPEVPSSVKALLRDCLTKDPRARLADIAGALFVFRNRDLLAAAADVTASSRPWSWRVAAGGVLLLAAVVAVSGWLGWTLRPAEPVRSAVTTFRIPLADKEQFTNPNRRLVAASPDGRRVVFAAGQRLNVRELGQLDATPIRGTEGTGPTAPRAPFFSPDSEWVGYWVGTELRKIPVNGGAANKLATLGSTEPFGAHWGDNDIIVFATPEGVWRIPGTGGSPELIVKSEAGRLLMQPELLPGGRALLYTAARGVGNLDDADVVIKSLDGGAETRIVAGSSGRYVPTGHIVFVVRGVLMAVEFDLERLAASGGPVALVDDVAMANTTGTAHFDLSSSGTLVYVAGPVSGTALRTPTWVDRQGRETPLGAPPRPYLYLRLAPDQTRVAFDIDEDNRDIHLWDVRQRAMKRLTTEPGPDRAPVFSGDSRRIIYSSDRGGIPNLFWRSADGVDAPERLTDAPRDAHFAMSVTADGALLVRVSPGGTGGTLADIVRRSMDREGTLTPLVHDQFVEQNAEVSHNGRWMAFQTDESGRHEILVRPYPSNDAEFPVSSEGGTEPLWSTDDSELFFRSLNGAIMRVRVKPGPVFEASPPAQVLPGDGLRLSGQGSPFRTYDVSSDGRRFLVLKNVVSDQRTASATMVVVTNWFEELIRRVPGR
jgi:serine/threonine-protein kinase